MKQPTVGSFLAMHPLTSNIIFFFFCRIGPICYCISRCICNYNLVNQCFLLLQLSRLHRSHPPPHTPDHSVISLQIFLSGFSFLPLIVSCAWMRLQHRFQMQMFRKQHKKKLKNKIKNCREKRGKIKI